MGRRGASRGVEGASRRALQLWVASGGRRGDVEEASRGVEGALRGRRGGVHRGPGPRGTANLINRKTYANSLVCHDPVQTRCAFRRGKTDVFELPPVTSRATGPDQAEKSIA